MHSVLAVGKTDLFYNSMGLCGNFTGKCQVLSKFRAQYRRLVYLTNREALTVLCSVVKHARCGQSTKEMQRETRDVVECFSLLLGFSIRFMIKNSLNSPRITFNFEKKLYFQSEQQCRVHKQYCSRLIHTKLLNGVFGTVESRTLESRESLVCLVLISRSER